MTLLLFYIIWKDRIKKSSNVDNLKQREANRLSRKFLGEAKIKLGDKNNFYDSLELALYNYLKARLKIKPSDYSKEKIASVLKKNRIPNQEIDIFIQVIKNCEMARFSPTTNVKMKKDFDQALVIMAAIDKKI